MEAGAAQPPAAPAMPAPPPPEGARILIDFRGNRAFYIINEEACTIYGRRCKGLVHVEGSPPTTLTAWIQKFAGSPVGARDVKVVDAGGQTNRSLRDVLDEREAAPQPQQQQQQPPPGPRRLRPRLQRGRSRAEEPASEDNEEVEIRQLVREDTPPPPVSPRRLADRRKRSRPTPRDGGIAKRQKPAPAPAMEDVQQAEAVEELRQELLETKIEVLVAKGAGLEKLNAHLEAQNAQQAHLIDKLLASNARKDELILTLVSRDAGDRI